MKKEESNITEGDDIRNNMRAAMESGNADLMSESIEQIWTSDSPILYADLLNQLLVTPGHNSHQEIAKYLQDVVKSPSSIPYIRIALASNFDYLEYTCSESEVIAKWFSWLLFEIGTDEAIAVMEEYSGSADSGISREMKYRLSKVYRSNIGQ